jgi:large subunit ribosomal protein L3
MSNGLLGRKVGMTTIFDALGNQVQCTVVDVASNVVTQIRTEEVDGYRALQLGFGAKKPKRTTKALQGHFAKAKATPRRHVVEFRDADVEAALGDELSASDVFAEGDIIDVAGTSKGKGFQGVVKRHGFAGVGDRTHGQHNRQRAPGSIGASSSPSRVFKGIRMAGQTGNARVTVKNLRVVKILADQNVILIEGAIPGAKNGIVELTKKTKVA